MMPIGIILIQTMIIYVVFPIKTTELRTLFFELK